MVAVEIVSTRQETDDDWMRDAACKGLTHLFFPSPAERPQARERREATARQVCRGCPVNATCRGFRQVTARIRVLGRRERGRTPRRRLSPDRTDRRARPLRGLTEPSTSAARTPMFDVCVVGSANLDLVATAARAPAPGETVLGHSYAEHAGGKGLNQAVAAARSGAATAFLGALGTDEAAVRLRDVLEHDGIDHAGVRVVDGLPSGRALITVGDDGENSIVVVAGANGAVVVDSIPPTRVVLAQLEIPLDTIIEAFRLAQGAGATTVLNPAPAAELPDGLLELTDIVIPNQHEVTLLGGPEHLLERGPTTVIVTLGGDGARWYSPTGVDGDPSPDRRAGRHHRCRRRVLRRILRPPRRRRSDRCRAHVGDSGRVRSPRPCRERCRHSPTRRRSAALSTSGDDRRLQPMRRNPSRNLIARAA